MSAQQQQQQQPPSRTASVGPPNGNMNTPHGQAPPPPPGQQSQNLNQIVSVNFVISSLFTFRTSFERRVKCSRSDDWWGTSHAQLHLWRDPKVTLRDCRILNHTPHTQKTATAPEWRNNVAMNRRNKQNRQVAGPPVQQFNYKAQRDRGMVCNGSRRYAHALSFGSLQMMNEQDYPRQSFAECSSINTPPTYSRANVNHVFVHSNNVTS